MVVPIPLRALHLVFPAIILRRLRDIPMIMLTLLKMVILLHSKLILFAQIQDSFESIRNLRLVESASFGCYLA